MATYNIGDVVLIRAEITREMAEYFNEGRRPYLGQIVKIDRIGGDVFYLAEGTAFRTDAIERKLSEEELKEWNSKEKERMEALKEQYRELYFTTQRVEELASGIFGADRVDVVDAEKNSFDVIILFPELTLTNSEDSRHDVKDLYVKFNVLPKIEQFGKTGTYKAEIKMTGRRGKLTLREYESGYHHSHLPTSLRNWGEFCLGSSAFKMVLEETKMELSEDAWMKLLLSLPNYLNWESLEGGPHFKMRGLGYKESVGQGELEQELTRITGGIPKDVWTINEQLTIIPAHPALHQYFNTFSKIRKISGYSAEQYKKIMKEKQRTLEYSYREHPIIWKGAEIKPLIIEEEITEEIATNIETGVVDKYCQILKNKSKSFLKQKNYNDAKRNNYKKVFGETRAVQQAHASVDEAVARQNSLST